MHIFPTGDTARRKLSEAKTRCLGFKATKSSFLCEVRCFDDFYWQVGTRSNYDPSFQKHFTDEKFVLGQPNCERGRCGGHGLRL